jgi:hypothetical protein
MVNYPSAADAVIRNIAQIVGVEILEEKHPWRIVSIPEPGTEGAVLWVVNEKGFLWEPVSTVEEARAYIQGPEAQEYAREAENG